ncbi:MAG: VOC family protein [Deltaproteobacteria bacterium]|nr:VOC family protein [Deltaproteobacteria bacterium]
MSMVTGIAHIGLRVHDLETSREFYEKLGFQFVMGPVGPEPVAIMEHPAGIEINFILNAAESSRDNVLMDVDIKHAGYTHLALKVASLDDTIARLEAEGIPLSGGPIQFPTGARAVFVRDPDRNVIELNEAVGAAYADVIARGD